MPRENVIVAVFGALLFAVNGYAQDTSTRIGHFRKEIVMSVQALAGKFMARSTGARVARGVARRTSKGGTI